METNEYAVMIGLTMTKITGGVNSYEIIFYADNGLRFNFYHEQDCCEHVSVEDIAGDLQDLIGSPILQAEEVSNEPPEGQSEVGTWTFYHFATVKGSVTIRWLGTSNGYYSEGVDFHVEGGKKEAT